MGVCIDGEDIAHMVHINRQIEKKIKNKCFKLSSDFLGF
jgi:hypothetical protein